MPPRKPHQGGAWEVTGPNTEGKTTVSEGAAISAAMALAVAWPQPATWYVRLLDELKFRVERTEQHVVLVIRAA